jgi:CheY-like chemotaxis protein
VETVRPLIAGRRQVLTLVLPDQPIWLTADPTRLEQVLVNLLTNAAKYTDEGGRLEVTVQRAATEMLWSVRDTGIGISADVLPRIFDLFTQADRSLDRSQGGLGIGLTLVRRLVEMHGGTVEAHSEGLGRGSEFVVRLPVAPPLEDPPAPAEVAAAGGTGRPLRILVVDDNVDSAHSLSLLLQTAKHMVRVAHTGPGAMETALAFRPEVVLLDLGLPEMDGYEVARQLRARSELAKIVIIAVTGYGQESDRHRSREAGFDCHLLKPVDWPTLERLLETAGPVETESEGQIPSERW